MIGYSSDYKDMPRGFFEGVVCVEEVEVDVVDA